MKVGLENLIAKRTEDVRSLTAKAHALAESLSREIGSNERFGYSLYGPHETIVRAAQLVELVAKLRATQQDLDDVMALVSQAVRDGEGESVDFPKHTGEGSR